MRATKDEDCIIGFVLLQVAEPLSFTYSAVLDTRIYVIQCYPVT